MSVISTERLREMEVLDMAGNRLASIKDLLIDPQSGQTRYAVLAVGPAGLAGAFGIGERMIAVPYAVLQLDSGQLVLQRDATVLAAAPSFPPSQPPDFNHSYEARLADYWSVPHYWEADLADSDSITAGDLVERALSSIPASASLHEIATALVSQRAEAAQVVDAQGQYLGVITLRDVGAAVGQRTASAPISPRTPDVERATAQNAPAETPSSHVDPEQSDTPARTESARSSAAPTNRDEQPDATSVRMRTPADTTPVSEATSIEHPSGEPNDRPRTTMTGQPDTIRCQQCSATNRLGARFCANCGAQMR